MNAKTGPWESAPTPPIRGYATGSIHRYEVACELSTDTNLGDLE